MKYFSSSDKTLFLLFVIPLLFFFIILPIVDNQNLKENRELTEQFTNIKEQFTNIKIPKVDEMKCSKQCCKFTQWQPTFNINNPNIEQEELKDYIPSNMTCNYGNGGGCVCIKQSDYDYLSDHGQSFNMV